MKPTREGDLKLFFGSTVKYSLFDGALAARDALRGGE